MVRVDFHLTSKNIKSKMALLVQIVLCVLGVIEGRVRSYHKETSWKGFTGVTIKFYSSRFESAQYTSSVQHLESGNLAPVVLCRILNSLFVHIQGHVIIPLLPLVFPVMWIVINCFGTARIHVLFETEISKVQLMHFNSPSFQ